MVSTDSTGTELIHAIVIARASLFERYSGTIVRAANLTTRRIEIKGSAFVTVVQYTTRFIATVFRITCGFTARNWIATVHWALAATDTTTGSFLAKKRTRAEDGAVNIGRIEAIKVRRTSTEIATFAL
jgi:hypothetical protein